MFHQGGNISILSMGMTGAGDVPQFVECAS